MSDHGTREELLTAFPEMIALMNRSDEVLSGGNSYHDPETGKITTVRSRGVNNMAINEGRPSLVPSFWKDPQTGEYRAMDDESEFIPLAAEYAKRTGIKWPEFESHSEEPGGSTHTAIWASSLMGNWSKGRD